jgi:hypothetical protein
MVMNLRLIAFSDNIRDSMRIVRHDQVPSRIPEKLTAALTFYFSAPPFFCPGFPLQEQEDGLAKRGGAKRQKTSWNILIFDSPSLLCDLAPIRKPSETAASAKAANGVRIGS